MKSGSRVRLTIVAAALVLFAGSSVLADSLPCGYDPGDFGAGFADSSDNPLVNPVTDDDVDVAVNPTAHCAVNEPGGLEKCVADALDQHINYTACYITSTASFRVRGQSGVNVSDIKVAETSSELQSVWIGLERPNVIGRIGQFEESPQGGSNLHIYVNDAYVRVPTLSTDTPVVLTQRVANFLKTANFRVDLTTWDEGDPEFQGEYIVIHMQRYPVQSPIYFLKVWSEDPAITTTRLVLEEGVRLLPL